MRAGQLRHRVTITDTLEVSDGHHGFAEDQKVVLATRIPAEVTMLKGYELVRAQQVDPRASYGVLIRYMPGLKAGQTVVYHDDHAGDRPLEVVARPIETEERHRALQLLCREAA